MLSAAFGDVRDLIENKVLDIIEAIRLRRSFDFGGDPQNRRFRNVGLRQRVVEGVFG
jgi:hypothetical protein